MDKRKGRKSPATRTEQENLPRASLAQLTENPPPQQEDEMALIGEINPSAIFDEPANINAIMAFKKSAKIDDILTLMPCGQRMRFITDNLYLLKKIGKYEAALLDAYTGIRTNYSNWSLDVLRFLFGKADIEKLREAGNPIPEQENYILYRGVSGRGRQRRVNSFSWTDSPNIAAWYAKRFLELHLFDPAVYTVTVSNKSIMAYYSERKESEYLLKLPLSVKPKRLKEMPEAFLSRD